VAAPVGSRNRSGAVQPGAGNLHASTGIWPLILVTMKGETTMKTLLKTALAVLPLVVATGAAQAAGDASAGRSKAAVCAACHGPNGVSANPQWPNLAGQKDLYIIKQLKAFRDGTRVDPLMSAQAQPLSDRDIEDLAAYFSSLK
jgi:cytochrome c553